MFEIFLIIILDLKVIKAVFTETFGLYSVYGWTGRVYISVISQELYVKFWSDSASLQITNRCKNKLMLITITLYATSSLEVLLVVVITFYYFKCENILHW